MRLCDQRRQAAGADQKLIKGGTKDFREEQILNQQRSTRKKKKLHRVRRKKAKKKRNNEEKEKKTIWLLFSAAVQRISNSLERQEPLTPHPSCGSNVAGHRSRTRASPQQAATQKIVNQGLYGLYGLYGVELEWLLLQLCNPPLLSKWSQFVLYDLPTICPLLRASAIAHLSFSTQCGSVFAQLQRQWLSRILL